MRDCEIGTVEGGDVQGAWAELQADGRIILSITFCEFDFAEETIGLIRWKDGSFEVGIGESLRPYDVVYRGTDETTAINEFWRVVAEHVLGETYDCAQHGKVYYSRTAEWTGFAGGKCTATVLTCGCVDDMDESDDVRAAE